MDAPTPTNDPKAAAKFINGKVNANPAMPNGPTPWPMNMLSVMLYSDEAVMAMMEGMANLVNNFPMGSVPKIKGECFIDIYYFSYFGTKLLRFNGF